MLSCLFLQLSPACARPINDQNGYCKGMAAVACRALPIQRVFTDASVKEGRIGIGINHQTRRMIEKYNIVCHPKRRPDSNHAELAAIFVALIDGHPAAHIFSDSQSALTMIRNGTADPRFDVLVRCSRWMLRKNDGVRLLKVKAHAGIAGNELAHNLAAAGRDGTQIVLPDVLVKQERLRECMIADVINDCVNINQWHIEAPTTLHNCARPSAAGRLRGQ